MMSTECICTLLLHKGQIEEIHLLL